MDIPRPRPELMAIGDSLAQGCRSLSVNRDFCAQSWGARIARSQKWEFATPDMPWPILFDLEEEIRRLNPLTVALAAFTFGDFIERLKTNQLNWFHATPGDSQHQCFDNLGLAGALVCDLYARSSDSSLAEIDQMTAGRTQTMTHPRNIGDLHLALNGWFTLNPSKNPDWAKLTPLQWAEIREPRRLLVQIGHNHGLFEFGFKAKENGDPETSLTAKGTAPFQQPLDDFWVQWEKLAQGLAALPRSIETILVVLLPKVGAVASLTPGSDKRTNGYADYYEPAFAPEPNILSGAQVQEADQVILNIINPRIRQIVTDAAAATGTQARVQFLDAWTMFDGYDYKNSLQTTRRIRVDTNEYIDNRYLNGVPPLIHLPWLPGNRLAEGGFQSVDGMHPSGAGYALLAFRAMQVLGLPADQAGLLQSAFAEDKLLSQYPVQLDYLGSALHILRHAQHANHFVPNFQKPLDSQSHVSEILHAMASVFHP